MIMSNKHTPYDLKQMQSIPLEAKIIMTQQRIRQWYDHWDGEVYVSFSGGKDSTVLKHIVDNTPGVYDVPAVFVNTGLEYPEIQRFVKDVQAGKWDCFNSNVEIVRPEMRFDEVLKIHGYPVISKRVSGYLNTAKRNPDSMRAKFIRGDEWTMFVTGGKYTYLIDSPFPISDQCCNVMKKKPAKKYAHETDCSVYGNIVVDYIPETNETQVTIFDILGDYDGLLLKTTGCNRTGCIFCMFGCHLEKEPNRFQRLKETHPRQYEYCINGGEMVDGKWQPSKEGLGLGKVLDYIGVKYD